MKEKTPKDMTIETIGEILRLKSASECSIKCEDREKKSVEYLMPSFELSSMSTASYLMSAGTVSICHGGYDNDIQKCPKYQAKIGELKESAKAFLEKI